VRCRAGDAFIVSHQSAVVLHGLPTWGLDLSRVHLTRAGGRGRSDRIARLHTSPVPDGDLTQVDGVPVTAPARAVTEAAAASTYETAVILMDAALQRGLTTVAELREVARRLRHWRGAPVVTAAGRFADARAESPGESRLRIILDNHGLPAPQLQAELTAPDGSFVARVDFLFPEQRVVVEFDGAVKYAGAGGADAVVAEKWREDRIRELGYLVIRVSWSDLDDPARIAERLHRAFARTAASPPHTTAA
jgi:hypothetical protein